MTLNPSPTHILKLGVTRKPLDHLIRRNIPPIIAEITIVADPALNTHIASIQIPVSGGLPPRNIRTHHREGITFAVASISSFSHPHKAVTTGCIPTSGGVPHLRVLAC